MPFDSVEWISIFFFRAKFYHSDPGLRKTDTSGTRQRRRGKKRGHEFLDVLDGELMDDDEGVGPFRPPRERLEFPEIGWGKQLLESAN